MVQIIQINEDVEPAVFDNLPPMPEEPGVSELRRLAYQTQADPIFFRWQAGEEGVTREDWLSARQAVRDQYPYED